VTDPCPDLAIPASQHRLLTAWNALSAHDRTKLAAEVAEVDFGLLERLWSETRNVDSSESVASRVARAGVPRQLVRLIDPDRQSAVPLGEELLRTGQVGVILVAGGQGTRLGFDQPKGLYPISPVRGAPLFALFGEQIRELGRRFGRPIPWFVMTSDATHEETVAAFTAAGHFGLPSNDIYFFRQGRLPALDRATGELLLAGPSALALAPDGHGGLVKALHGAGLLDVMAERGLTTLFYHQVDNPLVRIADPITLGLHVRHGAEVTTKVVAKLNAAEKVGLLADLDGRTEVIEYSDFPADLARETLPDGSLRFWAGNTAIHVFQREFLVRLASGTQELPYHRAVKTVPFWDGTRVVEPRTENALKFERFIFDALPAASIALVVETDRDEEFTPLKNATGDFSPEHVRRALSARARTWLRSANVSVPDEGPIEIDARLALGASELHGAAIEISPRNGGWWVTGRRP
jgi:UDP-N-acetylglucosamine/UDP-N-acetylgalactosamine diphosphorylase